jgi:Fur family ferric uptake transcriptional regulator
MKSKIKGKIDRTLKAAKLRRTQARASILNVLLAAKKPLNQAQIAKKIAKQRPNKVTIYRTLKSLIDAGLVHQAFLRERTRHFELAHNCSEKQCHPHFFCTNCGDTSCLIDIKVPMVSAEHRGFLINRQQVHLEGLCPNCN